ncbi:hypothetical protein [Novosphingobium kaempferiae]|uniref:hypothetical protein n=1 Tax=Novosphingobium kaempferiae TaxID=2896849 RepID=UPI001E2A1C0C|nr:hypothetical protein [Novosphingobium kaempferiae]
MADSITTIIAKAIHKGRSDIPWEASASQDTAYRDARSAMSAMPHPSERHAPEAGEDAEAIERLQSECNRFRGALLQIKYAAEDGRICDDVAWFSQHETLFDYIEGTLETAQAAVGDLFQGALRDCPFCGGKAIRRDDPGVPDVPFGLVVDHQPGCFLGFRDLQSDAAIDAAWNMRVPVFAPAASEAAAWMSIEFAPKDGWGSPILTCRMGDAPDWFGNEPVGGYAEPPEAAYWNEHGDCWTPCQRPHDGWEPTHWRPLDPAPGTDPQLHGQWADAVGRLILWAERASPMTDDASDFLNEGGWDELAEIAATLRPGLRAGEE